MNRRYCLTLDLKNDPALISEYKRHHERIWPEITKSIRDAGVEDLEIYLFGTRMVMILEVNESFSFEKKTESDRNNPAVQEWETLMWKFQQPLPQARPGEKWLLMEKIFKLDAQFPVKKVGLERAHSECLVSAKALADAYARAK